jgi:hypothetical protein
MGVHKRNGVVYLDVHKLPERQQSEIERRRLSLSLFCSLPLLIDNRKCYKEKGPKSSMLNMLMVFSHRNCVMVILFAQGYRVKFEFHGADFSVPPPAPSRLTVRRLSYEDNSQKASCWIWYSDQGRSCGRCCSTGLSRKLQGNRYQFMSRTKFDSYSSSAYYVGLAT